MHGSLIRQYIIALHFLLDKIAVSSGLSWKFTGGFFLNLCVIPGGRVICIRDISNLIYLCEDMFSLHWQLKSKTLFAHHPKITPPSWKFRFSKHLYMYMCALNRTEFTMILLTPKDMCGIVTVTVEVLKVNWFLSNNCDSRAINWSDTTSIYVHFSNKDHVESVFIFMREVNSKNAYLYSLV